MSKKIKLFRKKPEVRYVGSTIQQNHGESLDHGILVWDIETRKAEFVEIENEYGYITFEVKGTSLKGYDTSISFVATLRKPKETLNNILSSTPKQLEKLFSNLSVKKKPANGRINEQMVIVKVVENKL
jgi:hypothetical protein